MNGQKNALADFFLKISGIDGESKKANKEKWIELESWSWGCTNGGTSRTNTGSGAGKVSMQDFHFVMSVNAATPALFLACCDGEHLKEATLVCRKAGKEQQEYLTIKFTNLIISSFLTSGSEGEDLLPTNSISFNFKKVEWEYKPQKTEGGTLEGPKKAGFDVETNKKV